VNFGQIIKYNTPLKRMIIYLLPLSYINLYELIITSNLVKLGENIFGCRFLSVLKKYIGLWHEYCRSFCTSDFINQGNNIPDEVHIFFNRKYKDCFSPLYEESGQKKIVPEDCTFVSISLSIVFLSTVQTTDKNFAQRSFDWLNFYIRESAMDSNLFLPEYENKDCSPPRKVSLTDNV